MSNATISESQHFYKNTTFLQIINMKFFLLAFILIGLPLKSFFLPIIIHHNSKKIYDFNIFFDNLLGNIISLLRSNVYVRLTL